MRDVVNSLLSDMVKNEPIAMVTNVKILSGTLMVTQCVWVRSMETLWEKNVMIPWAYW